MSHSKDQEEHAFNKLHFIKKLIELYCKKYITNNIHVHRDFLNLIETIPKIKSNSKIINQYKKIKKLIQQVTIINIDHNDISSNNNNNSNNIVDHIVYHFQNEVSYLTPLKSKVSDKTYALLNIVYHNITRSIDYNNTLYIVKYLLDNEKKKVNKSISIIDIVFSLLGQIAKLMNEDTKEYINITKDIFFYKSNKNTLIERYNLIFACIYILYSKDLDTTAHKPKVIIDERYRYLFTPCYIDRYNFTEVQIENELMKDDDYFLTSKPIELQHDYENIIYNNNTCKKNIQVCKI